MFALMITIVTCLLSTSAAVAPPYDQPGGAYRISPRSLEFYDAENYCALLEGKLADIESESKYNRVVQWLFDNFNDPRRRGESFWTGMHFREDEQVETSTGAVGYLYWTRKNPPASLPLSSYPLKTGILLATKWLGPNTGGPGMWNWETHIPENKRRALCQTWMGKLYFSKRPLSFEDAEEFCRVSSNYRLVRMETEAKYNDVINFVFQKYNKPKRRGESFWTGMTVKLIDDNEVVLIDDRVPGYEKRTARNVPSTPLSVAPEMTKMMLATKYTGPNTGGHGMWNWSPAPGNKRRALCEKY